MKLDRDILETYLDGELDAARRAEVDEGLRSDAAAAGLLAQLRDERTLRMAVWQSYEPPAREVAILADHLLSRVEEAADVPVAKIEGGQMNRWVRRSAAVAAVLAIVVGSFFAGRSSVQSQGGNTSGTTYEVVITTLDGRVKTAEFSSLEEATDFAQKQSQNTVASTADESGVFSGAF